MASNAGFTVHSSVVKVKQLPKRGDHISAGGGYRAVLIKSRMGSAIRVIALVTTEAEYEFFDALGKRAKGFRQ